MRSLLIGIVLAVTGLNALAQPANDSCNFLKNLKFKNGRDTIVIKAVLRACLEAPPRLLNKHPSIYDYKFDSYIDFQPENCSKEYDEPLLNSAVIKAQFLNGENLGITIYLTCVVFNEHSSYTNGDPDCLVIKVVPAIKTAISIPEKCDFMHQLYSKMELIP
jgi:hypothetical protein